jgi:hypothetical protein
MAQRPLTGGNVAGTWADRVKQPGANVDTMPLMTNGTVLAHEFDSSLPGSDWRLFDVRHDFPDAWQVLRNSCGDSGTRARLDLRLERAMFPYIPGAHELSITQMMVLFKTRADEHVDCLTSECLCPRAGPAACRAIECSRGSRDRPDDSEHVPFVASEDSPDLYCGIFDTRVGPLGRPGERDDVTFRFPAGIGELECVYLLCRYQGLKLNLGPLGRQSN